MLEDAEDNTNDLT